MTNGRRGGTYKACIYMTLGLSDWSWCNIITGSFLMNQNDGRVFPNSRDLLLFKATVKHVFYDRTGWISQFEVSIFYFVLTRRWIWQCYQFPLDLPGCLDPISPLVRRYEENWLARLNLCIRSVSLLFMVNEEHCKGLLVMPESGELIRDILLDLRLHVEETVVELFWDGAWST